MTFHYPRKISIERSQQDAAFGKTEYAGVRNSTVVSIAKNVPAAIQFKGPALRPPADLPQDTMRRTMWRILIPGPALVGGMVHVRDYIKDDLGVRYQVISPDFSPLGHALLVERLET